jgi:hypothetical protein
VCGSEGGLPYLIAWAGLIEVVVWLLVSEQSGVLQN